MKGVMQISLVVVIIVSLFVVLGLAIVGQGQIEKEKKQIEPTKTSLYGLGFENQCNTFCSRFYALPGDSEGEKIQKNKQCVLCKNGESYNCDSSVSGDCDVGNHLKCDDKSYQISCYDFINNLKNPKSETGGGATAGKHIVLVQGEKQVPPGKLEFGTDTYVAIKSGESAEKVADNKLTLELQNSSGKKIDTLPSNQFTVPPTALVNGRYALFITVSSDAQTLKASQPFMWQCPGVLFEKDVVFGAGKTIIAAFESKLSSTPSISVKTNGNALTWSKVSNTPPQPYDDRKISFMLPKFGSGLIEGENKLYLLRQNEGLCKSGDDVKNEFTKTFNWVCPRTGCYKQGADEFVLDAKVDSGGYEDADTGCRYSTRVEPKCEHGCLDGACKRVDLRIDSIKLEDFEIYDLQKTTKSAYIYGAESISDGKVMYVAVSNTGLIDAPDVRVKVDFNGREYEPFGSEDCGTSDKILSKKNCTFKFSIPAGSEAGELPIIRLSDIISGTFPELSLSASAQDAVEIDAKLEDNTYTSALKVYPPCDDTNTCKRGQSICEKCPTCTWENTCKFA